MASLEGRTDAAAETFVLRAFDAVPKFAAMKSASPSGQDFNELLAYLMARGTPKMQKALVAAHKTLAGGMLPPVYNAARETMTPAAFFQEFSPLLAALGGKRAKKGAEQERASALADALTSPTRRRYFRSVGYVHLDGDGPGDGEPEPPPRELDPRWLDAAIGTQSLELVCQLARPGHAGLNKFLSEQLADKKMHEEFSVLQTMVQINHPGAADAIIDTLKKQAKSSTHYYGYWYSRMIPDLPRSALPKLEALLPELPEKMVDQLMESVMALKAKPNE